MALPNKVVEQLGRAPVRTPGWSGRVLMFSATFLIIALATFIGIRFGLRPYTTSRINSVNQRVAEFSQRVPLDQQLQIAALYSQVLNLRSLLEQQVSQVDFLRWIERNTNVNVQILSLSFDKQKMALSLNGVARNLENLAEQMNLYRSQQGIVDRVDLQGVTPPPAGATGPWEFQMSLVLNRNFYPKIMAPVVIQEPEEEDVDEGEVLDEGLPGDEDSDEEQSTQDEESN